MTSTSFTSQGTLRDRAVDVALRAGIKAAQLVPYDWRVPAFGKVTARLVTALPRFATRMEDNLDFVFPDHSQPERCRIARAAADNFGRLIIENYSGRQLARRMADVSPHGPGLATLAQAKSQGRPVLLLTGHFGNYEAARACLIAQGYPVGGLFRPLANPYFNRHYVQTMEQIGGPIFAQGREGTTGLMRHLKAGGMAMLLNDLYVGSGTELPFLGRPAMTATSAAEIALRRDAALIPVYGIRAPDGLSFQVEVEAEIPPSDPLTMTRAYNESVEARIRAHPEQWFWLHRRWKRKWAGGAGDTGDLHPAAQPRRKRRL